MRDMLLKYGAQELDDDRDYWKIRQRSDELDAIHYSNLKNITESRGEARD